MKTRGTIGALLLAVMPAAGCTAVVEGTVRPASGMTPWPITGRVVEHVLLNDVELSTMLDQSFESDADFPPRLGGAESMPDGLSSESDASPHDCVGAATGMQRSVYSSADVQDIAVQSWWNAESDAGARVIEVKEGVVALPTAADADVLFAEFIEQWKDCEGVTVTVLSGPSLDGGYFTDEITDVRVSDSVLAATIRAASTSDSMANPEARAIGVRVNCLVEVQVSFYSGQSSSKRIGTANPETSAIDIARQMMDRISELS